MGADIENPDLDGCVAEAVPSRNTFKERLVTSFLRNPNAAGGGDCDDKAEKTANGVGGVGGVDAAATEPAKRGWRYYVLHVCGTIAYVVFAVSMFPLMNGDKDRLHIVLGIIGVVGGIIMTLFLCGAAEVE